MANKKIKDLPLISSENITGDEIIPVGGKGDFAIKLASIVDPILNAVNQNALNLDGSVGARKLLHVESQLTDQQISTLQSSNTLTLNLSDNYSYKFFSPELIGQATLQDTSVAFKTVVDGVFEVVIDIPFITTINLGVTNVFFNSPELSVSQQETVNRIRYNIVYTKIGAYTKAVISSNPYSSGSTPSPEGLYVSYNIDTSQTPSNV